MNAVIISPLTAELDASPLDRAEDIAALRPLPPVPASAFKNMEYIAAYDNIIIWRLKCGLFYSFETGLAWTVTEVRDAIIKWREGMNDEYQTEGPPCAD